MLGAIVPAHNEEQTIRKVLGNIIRAGIDAQHIFVVDNNSSDKTKKILTEIGAVKKNKGKIIYTNEKEMSSSRIINKLGLALNEKQTKFLELIKKSSSYESIVNSLNKIKKDKILVIGDLIIDKYIFGRVLGKSGKEPHMVFSKATEECYIGGSSIIANHVSDFVNNITL